LEQKENHRLFLGEQGNEAQGPIKIIRGCPVYKVFGDERLCVNDDNILEIEAIEIDPSLFGFNPTKESLKEERAPEGNICYVAIYTDSTDNRVYCISQGWKLRIHNQDVRADDLQDALQFLSTKDLDASAEICSECLYKFLITLSSSFADLLSLKEKADEIKKYVDKFSLMIAVKHSEMDDMMKSIGSEDDIDKDIDHFAFLRQYLVQLLEQQEYWSRLCSDIKEEDAEDWLIDLVVMRERLARLEFQFYSQTLQLRELSDFTMLIKMLHFILHSSSEILSLNEKIHSEIRSKRFNEVAEHDQRFSHLCAYGEKSSTVEHNFGNILLILSRL
jgi:hypothetical protein